MSAAETNKNVKKWWVLRVEYEKGVIIEITGVDKSDCEDMLKSLKFNKLKEVRRTFRGNRF